MLTQIQLTTEEESTFEGYFALVLQKYLIVVPQENSSL